MNENKLSIRLYGEPVGILEQTPSGKKKFTFMPKHWEQFCEKINYKYLAIIKLIGTLGNKIKEAAIQEKKQLQTNEVDNPIFDKIINLIEKNIYNTLKKFDNS